MRWALALTVVALCLAGSGAWAQSIVAQGSVTKVEFNGLAHTSVYINIDQDAYDAGYRLRIVNRWNAPQCDGDGRTNTCTNLAGKLFAELTAPNVICAEAEIKFSNRGNPRFITGVEGNFYCTPDDIVDAYWYGRVGQCGPDAVTVTTSPLVQSTHDPDHQTGYEGAKYSPPEAKHVCTNHGASVCERGPLDQPPPPCW